MSYIDDTRGVLNDLFTNNIDYVAKQVQTIVDFLFPNNEDNSDTTFDSSNVPLILCGQIEITVGYGYIGYDWTSANCVYNVQFNSSNTENMIMPIGKSPVTSDAAWNKWGQNADMFLLQALPEYADRAQFFNNYPEYYGQGIEPVTVNLSADGSLVPYKYGNSGLSRDGGLYMYFNRNHGEGSLSTDLSTGYLYFLGADKGKNIIITDNSHSDTFYRNNVIYNNNDYHTYNTYNFNGGSGNGGGTVTVGGGAGGLVIGVGGLLNYNDIKFALDSLIDDLNINMVNADNKLPIDYFPSYDEVKYIDYGDFYIEKLHQYDVLPSAPTFTGDLVLSDYPKYIGTAAQSLLDLLPGIGLSALCCMCFLIGLITSKIRG